MPVARVQLPDGRVARLEVPEGTTPQQIEAFVFEQINREKPKAAPVEAPPEEPTRLERLGRGFMDVAQGVKQGALMVKDLITGGNEADAFTKEKSDELALYERGRGPDAGVDWMRIGGNILATAPVALIPGAGAASLGTRVASGAAQGATAAGAMFTPEGESKTAQIALGGAVGGAIPLAAQGVKSAARSVVDLVRGPQRLPASQVAREVSVRLQQQGIDFNKLSQQAKDALVSDAQRALSTGGTLDDVMLSNKALIESVGAKPTRASITRAPRDWQTEKNLRGIQGVGDDIVAREQQNAKALIDFTQKIRAAAGGKAATKIEAGESAIKAIKTADKAKEEAVGKLYDAFRSSGVQDVAVPDTRIADELGRVADEIGVENIPAAVLNRLKEFGFVGGKRAKLLTVNEADKLNRLINNNNPGQGPASLALQRIKNAVNQAVLDVPGDGSQALMTARKAAAQRFAEADASKGISAALDDISPDVFMDRFIRNVPIKDFRATVAELGKTDMGKQALKDIKGTILGDLLMKATGASSLDDVAGKPFSGVKFGKALDAIPVEKLHQLFTPEEVSSLRTLQKASKLLTEEVAFSDVNYSKTTAALANLLMKVGNAPILGQIVRPIVGAFKMGDDWMKDAAARKQVAEALIASAGREGAKPALPVFAAERAIPGAAAAFVSEPRAGER